MCLGRDSNIVKLLSQAGYHVGTKILPYFLPAKKDMPLVVVFLPTWDPGWFIRCIISSLLHIVIGSDTLLILPKSQIQFNMINAYQFILKYILISLLAWLSDGNSHG